jgi:hypothetical protein
MPGLGKKTFTAGDVLIAGDVNNYLMDQTVMNFATVAARSSAIPVPSTGMVSYVGDTGSETPASTIPQIQAYTGAAWQNLEGTTLLAVNTFASVAAVNFDNVFTSAYRNYKIIFNITGTSSASGGSVFWQGRTGGSTITSTYGSQYLRGTGSTVNAFTSGVAALGGATTAYATYVAMEANLYSPQLAQITTSMVTSLYVDALGNANNDIISGWHAGTNVFDGISFQFTSPATFSGTVRIYGIRNS